MRLTRDVDEMKIDLRVMDSLRGLAAMYVMLGHARWLLATPYRAYPAEAAHGPGFALSALMAVMLTWGHQAVLLFFLISGFCIHYRQAKRLASQPRDRQSTAGILNLGSYAMRRFRRLYPPLVAALVLTLVFDLLGAAINPSGASQNAGFTTLVGGGAHSVSTLVANLLIQPGVLAAPFGSDGPLWSLANEFWYYALYPLLLLLPWRGMRPMLATAAVASVAGLLASTFIPISGPIVALLNILSLWVVWVIGACIAEAYAFHRVPRWLGKLIPLAVILCVLAGVNVYLRPPSDRELGFSGGQLLTDLAWGLGLAVLLAYMMLALPSAWAKRVNRVAVLLVPLGAISYSLYLVHYPWLLLLSNVWLARVGSLPLGAELAVPGAVSALLVAAACWFFVERHFVSARPAVAAPSKRAAAPVAQRAAAAQPVTSV